MSIIKGINLGNLTDYLFFFSNGSADASWKDAKHGYLGNLALNGITADEHTNGNVPYAGTIYTNDTTLSNWQGIVDDNVGQAFSSLNQTMLITGLTTDLTNAFQQVNALPATPGYENRSSASLNGLNTQNGVSELIVINVTSGFDVSAPINITGDAGDVYVLRWDDDANFSNGYQGRVRFRQGGAIVPLGGLTPGNFIHVAGEIDSAGGGSTPVSPYPQGPRYNNGSGTLINGGSDWTAGGFFTGYWLTTGAPDILDPVSGLYYGKNSSISDATFVGGWYTLTTQFVLTAQSGGVYISPNPATIDNPSISEKKYVSPDNGITWIDAQIAPGPTIYSNVTPQFKFVVTNTGNVTLTNIVLTDNVYGPIGMLPSLIAGSTSQWIVPEPFSTGNHQNTATVTAQYSTVTVSSSDVANYVGQTVEEPAIEIIKYVSPDNGATWDNANTPPGPTIFSNVQPQFRYVVTNIGNEDLTNVAVTDDVLGNIGTAASLLVGQSTFFLANGTWQVGEHVNIGTVTADSNEGTVSDQNPAYYNGVLAIPGLTITKYVSPDSGTTWVDANSAPGPIVYSDVNPQFKYVVTNTGNVDLSDISVTDNIYGTIGTLPTLLAGETAEWVVTEPWQLGEHENIATVTATFNEETLTDTDNAWYDGEEVPNPAISIVKSVSVDGGLTWVDANTSPGPFLPNSMTAMFRYVVTNTGNVPLVNVAVNDSILGLIGTIPTIAVGASQIFIV